MRQKQYVYVTVSWLIVLRDGLFKYLLKTKPFSRDRYPTICLNCIAKMAGNLCKQIFLLKGNLFVETVLFLHGGRNDDILGGVGEELAVHDVTISNNKVRLKRKFTTAAIGQ